VELLALFHEALRGFSHVTHPHLYFRGQHLTAEEVRTNGFGEITPTPRTQICTASVHHVRGEFVETKSQVTGGASGDDMPAQ
jgi:hypothetical protein